MSSTIFLIIALVTTGIFVIQFILSIFFGDIDADVDVDTDISSGSPISESDLAGICIWQEIRRFKPMPLQSL